MTRILLGIIVLVVAWLLCLPSKTNESPHHSAAEDPSFKEPLIAKDDGGASEFLDEASINLHRNFR